MAEPTALLRELISYRTVNPGGDEPALCRYLGDALRDRGADHVDIVDVTVGARHGAYVYARYGTPRLLINAHVDTVPVNQGWTRDPFVAVVEPGEDGERLYGLGACDTKAAIAAILCALNEVRPDGVAVLFSGDEERTSTCLRAFLDAGRHEGIHRAIVCEPTRRAGGILHRGVRAYRARSQGAGGHSSRADHMPKPIVTLARLAVALDELGRRHLHAGPEEMKGLCANVAAIDGGVAFNVVPDEGLLWFSVRPPPGFDGDAFDAEVEATARGIDPAIAVERVVNRPPFACGDPDGFRALLGAHVSEYVGLDFWTEGATLAETGIDAIVLGPGDIAQAHGADEFVPVADLGWATALFRDVFEATRDAE